MASESLRDYHDPSLHKFVSRVTAICFSSEFLTLRNELQQIYTTNKVTNPDIVAFCDALYTLLVQETDKGHRWKNKVN